MLFYAGFVPFAAVTASILLRNPPQFPGKEAFALRKP